MEKKQKSKKYKVCVAIPCMGTMHAKTAFSLVHALKNVDFDYDLVMRFGCDLIGSRVGLVRQAQKTGATHMLFLDSDIHFPPQPPFFRSPISILLEQEKDIIGADYNFRQLPAKSTVIPLTEKSETEPYKANALGTGFLLIKMSVFDKIPEPWFQFMRDKHGELVSGEDTFFCQMAIKAGFDVWVDPIVKIYHLGEYQY